VLWSCNFHRRECDFHRRGKIAWCGDMLFTLSSTFYSGVVLCCGVVLWRCSMGDAVLWFAFCVAVKWCCAVVLCCGAVRLCCGTTVQHRSTAQHHSTSTPNQPHYLHIAGRPNPRHSTTPHEATLMALCHRNHNTTLQPVALWNGAMLSCCAAMLFALHKNKN